jgi:hypothetical protein
MDQVAHVGSAAVAPVHQVVRADRVCAWRFHGRVGPPVWGASHNVLTQGHGRDRRDRGSAADQRG